MNKKTPKLRFKEFTDDWKQRKLGDLGQLKNGMNFSKEAMGRGYPFVNLQNIFGRNTVDIENLGLAEASSQQLVDYDLKTGDVLFVRSSVKLEGVGEAVLVQKDLENTTYSGFIIRFRDKFGLDNEFKKVIFGTPYIRKQVLSKATNSANKNISQPVLENLEILIPQKEEQQKIGSFFTQLDNTITLQQRKLDKLIILKKAYLNQMFPKNKSHVPELRFSEFTDDWKQLKLGSIAEKVTQKNSNLEISETFTNSAEQGIISQKDFFDHKVSSSDNIGNYYVVDKGDFVYNPRISSTAPVGPINRNRLDRAGVVSPLYTVFRVKDVDSLFLEWYFKSSCWHLYMFINGDSGARSDRFAIKDPVFFSMPILVPSKEEQFKIGMFFEKLNGNISIQKRKLEKLKQLKASYLNSMFI